MLTVKPGDLSGFDHACEYVCGELLRCSLLKRCLGMSTVVNVSGHSRDLNWEGATSITDVADPLGLFDEYLKQRCTGFKGHTPTAASFTEPFHLQYT